MVDFLFGKVYNGCVENDLIYILAPVHRIKKPGMLLTRPTPSCHTEWFVYVKIKKLENYIYGSSYWQSLPLHEDDGILRKRKFETKEEAIMELNFLFGDPLIGSIPSGCSSTISPQYMFIDGPDKFEKMFKVFTKVGGSWK